MLTLYCNIIDEGYFSIDCWGNIGNVQAKTSRITCILLILKLIFRWML